MGRALVRGLLCSRERCNLPEETAMADIVKANDIPQMTAKKILISTSATS